MIIDAFMGLNEIPLAKFRIDYLKPIVDRTIILESNLTHSGKPKEFFFANWLVTNTSSKMDVEVVQVDLKGVEGAWNRERYSRDYLVKYIYDRYPNCTFVLSDLDEIPSLNQVRGSAKSLDRHLHLHTPTSYRFGNFMLTSRSGVNWNRVVIGSTNFEQLPQGGRFYNLPQGYSVDSGLHISHLQFEEGSINFKLDSFAHEELATHNLGSESVLAYANYWAIDHCGRFFSDKHGLLDVIPVEKFSGIQEFMFQHNPNWFNFPNPHPKLPRYFASFLITQIALGDKNALQLVKFQHSNSGVEMKRQILLFGKFVKILQTAVYKSMLYFFKFAYRKSRNTFSKIFIRKRLLGQHRSP